MAVVQSIQKPLAGKMRCIIAHPLSDCRAEIRRAIDGFPRFEVTAESTSWLETRTLVAEFVPELVICSPECSQGLEFDSAMPILVGIGGAPASDPERLAGTLVEPIEYTLVAAILRLAEEKIVTARVLELCWLTRHYVLFGGAEPTRTSLQVESNGQPFDLAISEITWIEASGNYVCLYTRFGSFRIRETISGIAASLEPNGFERVHRSAVVNPTAIERREYADGVLIAVRLADGTEIPVGPNFRDRLAALADSETAPAVLPAVGWRSTSMPSA